MTKTNPGAAVAAALLLALVAFGCDRDRSNPLDPQSDFEQNRPGAPAQLAAEPGVGVIRIAWQGGTDPDLAGYALFRAIQSNGTYAFVAGDGDSTAGITTGKTTFADSIRGANRTFFYRVAAVDTAGLQSVLTAFVGATALEDNIAPDAPQSLSAVSDEDVLGRVVLRWSAPQTDSDGRSLSGLAGYIVLRAESGTGGVVPLDTLVAGLREYQDDGLKTLTTYTYSMVAFDAAGNTSRSASAVQVTTAGLPTPSGLGAADEIGRIVITWGAVDDGTLIGYDLFRSPRSADGYVRLEGTEGGSFTTGRTTYIDSNLAGGELFFYRVRAVGQQGVVSESSTFVSGRALADESAPAAPRNVSAVADENDAGKITVGWSAPTVDADGGDLTGLDGFVLLRADDADGSFLPLDTLSAEVRTHVDIGLQALTRYRYAMIAFDAAGNQSSQALSGFTRTAGIPAPVGLSARDEIGRIVITWQSVDDADLAGYEVYRSDRSDNGYVRLEGTEGSAFTTGRTSYIDSNLAGGSLYYYKVQAVGTNDLLSERSAFVSGRAQADESAPGAPRNVSAVADENDSGQITVGWSAPAADADGGDLTGLDGFVLLRAENTDGSYLPLDTLSADIRSHVDTGLKALTIYRYAMVAFDAAGNQSPQAFSNATRTAGIPAPQGLSAQDEIGRIVITWQPVDDSDLAGYEVYRSARSDDGYVRLAGSEGTEFTTGRTTYIDSNLVGGSLFFYKVQAISTNDLLSERSAFVSGRVLDDESAPGAPRNVSAVADENDAGQITVGWSAPDVDTDGGDLTGLDGFVLMRAEDTGGSFLPLDTLGAEIRSHVDTGLKALTIYRYAMVAFDASGNQSSQALSNATRTAGIPVPLGLSAQDEIGRIVISWQPVEASELAGYEVFRSSRSDDGYVNVEGSEGTEFTTGRTTFVDSNLAGGSLFFYKVQAVGTNGLLSERSAFVSGRALVDGSAPGSPPNLYAVADGNDPGQIVVGWGAPAHDADGGDLTGLDGFILLRAEGVDGALLPLDTLGAELRTHVDTGLQALTTYRYALVAFDAAGNQSSQALSSATRTAGMPTPTALRAINGVGRITLEWQSVDSHDLLGYNVYRSTLSDGTYELLAGEGSSFTTGRTGFIDSTVAVGQLSYYRVAAVTSSLQSERSSFVSGQAAADDIAPASPADLVALADDVQALVSLSWSGSRVDQDGGTLTGLTSYIVFRGQSSATALVAVDTVDASSTTFADNALQAATTYYYAVSAVDDFGNVSPRSSAVSVTTQGIGAPANVGATGDVKSITVSWSASNESDLLGYNVYRSSRSDQGYSRLVGTEGASFTTGQTSYIDSNLTGGATLFYRVSVVTAAGESEQSAFDGATVQTDARAPAAPNFLTGEPVSNDPERLALSWRAPRSDADGSTLTGVSLYRIYRSGTVDGDFQEVGTSTTTSYADTSLDQRTTYYYQVEALDDDGNVGPRSSTVAATTSGVDLPTDVRLVASTPSNVSESPVVTIRWTKSAGAIVRYEVGRATVADSSVDSDYTAIVPNDLNTTRTDDGVTRATTYYYRVRAIDVDGRESDWTEPLGITVPN